MYILSNQPFQKGCFVENFIGIVPFSPLAMLVYIVLVTSVTFCIAFGIWITFAICSVEKFIPLKEAICFHCLLCLFISFHIDKSEAFDRFHISFPCIIQNSKLTLNIWWLKTAFITPSIRLFNRTYFIYLHRKSIIQSFSHLLNKYKRVPFRGMNSV